jgi:hypothetical protein
VEFIGVIFVGILLFRVLSWVIGNSRQARADAEMQAVGTFVRDLDRKTDVKKFSPWRRAYYFFRSLIGSRMLLNFEFSVEVQMAEAKMEIGFFVPRRAFRIDIFIDKFAELQVKDIQFHFEEGEINDRCGSIVRFVGDRRRIRLYSPSLRTISKIVLTFRKCDREFSYEVRIKALRDANPDYRIIQQAIRHYNLGQSAEVFETLEKYLQYSTGNPNVYFNMADACLKMERYSEFEDYILKSMVYGYGNFAAERYRLFKKDHWASNPEEVMKIRDECTQWSLDQHHGLVVLDYDQNFHLGLNDYYVNKVRKIIEVRRPVAARMFLRTGFDFTSRQLLLFTACRIIKNDGAIVVLPQERFVVGDSQDRNIFIAVEQKTSGSWILPDLAPGDIVEMCYHLVCHESLIVKDRRVPLSIVTTVHDQFLPTYIGRAKLRAPREYRLRYSLHDPKNAIELAESEEGGYQVISLGIDRYIPVNNTNSFFEAYLFNPVAACTTDEKEWPEIAESVLVNNFGDLHLEEDLPNPLQGFVTDSASPQEALRKAFYWTRDKLKYAAVDSAARLIGRPNRAASIVASGMADCKDKSYLLYLTGKKLGLGIQLVAVSSQHGVIFGDLPSDQFDHVLVRVRLDDRWYYLDAANRYAVFGSTPPPYQGMDTLVITDGSKLETMPIDSPENSRVIITETFDGISQGRLSGSFHLEARGNIARLIDENWKSQSLQAMDYLQAAQSIMESFMPSAVLSSFDRISHTAHTDTFEVLGMLHRCQLSAVGKNLVGTMEWNDPTMPTRVWRSLRVDQAFGFSLPSMIEMHAVFTGDLPGRMAECSDPFSMDNELCEISADRIQRGDDIVMRRRVVIKEKFVDKELLHLVPEVMKGIEKTFQMAIILENT